MTECPARTCLKNEPCVHPRYDVGATAKVFFNGSAYPGEVVSITKAGLRLVRFTTGAGKTRERKFSLENLTHYAVAESPRERGRTIRAKNPRWIGGLYDPEARTAEQIAADRAYRSQYPEAP